ncbi:MAG TPA: phosphotransferase [Pseudolysinimonas sp.]|nr:phosphotransferase [Pseudolysinimonas sp.]
MSTWMERPELAAYLARQRWFAGAQQVTVTQVQPLAWLSDPSSNPGVRFEIVSVLCGAEPAVYNVPLSYRIEPREDLSYGFIGAVPIDDRIFYVYDALHDPEARATLLGGFVEGAEPPADLRYDRLPGFALEPGVDNVLLGAEQSNTSVVAGDALVKFFRRLSPGANPDIEVQEALTLAGSDEISPLLGWIRGGGFDLAMAGLFQRSATDGWDTARASVRALRDDAVRAREAGGDFAGEAERLGAATLAVHLRMRELLPTAAWGPAEIDALVARLNRRLDAVVAAHPVVAEHAAGARAAYDRIDRSLPVAVQRIHGDFHLGQTLRTSAGWKIIDFEGEPSRPLEDRIRLDSPLRDLAGMLRSFDYVAHSIPAMTGVISLDPSIDEAALADDWVRRNQIAFLLGYGFERSDAMVALLRAYEIDKAVYEVAYEADHRPDWMGIPLRALTALIAAADVR